MPQTVTVYGASDDLIEIDGDLREEFPALDINHEEGGVIAFADGTVLSIRYDNQGFWRINRLHAGTGIYEKHEATDADSDYSDRVTLTGELQWVIFGAQYHKVTAPITA